MFQDQSLRHSDSCPPLCHVKYVQRQRHSPCWDDSNGKAVVVHSNSCRQRVSGSSKAYRHLCWNHRKPCSSSPFGVIGFHFAIVLVVEYPAKKKAKVWINAILLSYVWILALCVCRYLILIWFWRAPVAEHPEQEASSLPHRYPQMTCGPQLSCTWQVSYDIWPGKCPSYSYPQKSKWWAEPYQSVQGRGGLYHRPCWASDWVTSRHSRWPTDRSCPGPMTPTLSWPRMKVYIRQVSQSSDEEWCARGGRSHFWVRCGGSNVSASPAVRSGRQIVQHDYCQRSLRVTLGDSCAGKGLCGPRCRALLVQRRGQWGHRSCSIQNCWSLLSKAARGSRGCRPHIPLSRCPGCFHFPGFQECIGRLFFCNTANTQTSVCDVRCADWTKIMTLCSYLCKGRPDRTSESGRSGDILPCSCLWWSPIKQLKLISTEHHKTLICKLTVNTSRW